MLKFTSKQDVRAFSRRVKAEGKTVAFVPTMGYLHEGHLTLVKQARELADVVVVSIYVNPTQFSKNEDFDIYPRNAEADIAALQAMGVHAVFEPESLYESGGNAADSAHVVGRETADPNTHETYIQVERLQLPLCGRSRPHFFRGVATVVSKLFHIVEPDFAVFGSKDYQQLRVIRRMVRDLDFAVQIVEAPIAREADGLAMSSRNARLSSESRPKAVALSQSLKWAQAALDSGVTSPDTIKSHVWKTAEAAGGTPDYVELVDAENLTPITDVSAQPTLLALAVHFPAKDTGTVRLIDNAVLKVTAAAAGSS